MTDDDREMTPDRPTLIRRALESAVGPAFSDGNAIETLRNGEEIFPVMLEAIREAKGRIEFVTHVWWGGAAAAAMGEAFAERARAGVDVRLVLDAYESRAIDKGVLSRMKKSGCRICWFRPLARFSLWKNDNRTHRKILVVDGRVGFTGGVGIAAEWEGHAQDPDHRRDNQFRIHGPAVRGLRAGFWGNWMEMHDECEGALDALPALSGAGSAAIQVLNAQPASGWSAVARLQDALVRLAARRVRVQTPYLDPGEAQADCLFDALRRGVEVEFMIPGPHIDKRIGEFAGAKRIGRLLEAGLKLWRYQPTMIHSKLIVVDGEVASVGTANYNERSINKDHETAVTVLDRAFVAEMDAMWEDDRRRCEPQDAGDWRRRGFGRRIVEAASRPFKLEA